MLSRFFSIFLSATLLQAEPKAEQVTPITAPELHQKITALAPSLVESTIAIFIGGAGSGSGVIISPDGLCISAAHVTSTPGKEVTVLLDDGRELPALTLGVDHGTDGSLLKITAPGPFPYRPYIKKKNYQIGDWVLATGHPGGPIVGRPAPVRLGQISAAGTKNGFADAIVTNATVISGDSGGPLFNLDGEVIGINSNIGMNWQANQHVPLPAIVSKWDDLMESKTFGASDNVIQNDFPYDDPYQKLREQFLRELAKRPTDPLNKRPRALSPNEMQARLDQWEPELEVPQTPSLGIQVDLTHREITTITEILPDSPAAKAGVPHPSIITKVNGETIYSPTNFALALKQADPKKEITLEVNGSQTFTIQPLSIPRRRHFPMPLAGLVGMMINEEASGEIPTQARTVREELLNTAPTLSNSFLEIRRNDEVIVHATVIEETEILTKLSELGDLTKLSELTAHHGEASSSLTLINKDAEHDLALLKIDDLGLTPIVLRLREPRVGSLVFTPGDSSPILGCVTQPVRAAPKSGYEHNETANTPTGWLGVSFTPDGTSLTISTVEVGSPADTAGLLEGDLLIKFGNTEITTHAELSQAITPKAPGEKITLVIRRGEEELTFRPILGVQPTLTSGTFQQRAALSDDSLKSLSARGGELSKRRNDFPTALFHDQIITPSQAGTPLYDIKGRVIGINIARSFRHRTLAIPAKTLDQILWKLQK